MKNFNFIIGAFLFFILSFLSVFAPILSPNPPNKQFNPKVCSNLKPFSIVYENKISGEVSKEKVDGWKKIIFPFGTDGYGRCIFSRVLYGGRISLQIGILSLAVSLFIGTLIGIFSGYFGKIIDTILMRFVDTLLAFPRLFLLIILSAVLEKKLSFFGIILILGLFSWMEVSRLVRGTVLTLKERDFVFSAKAIGASDFRIIFKHILPHLKGLLLVDSTLRIAGLILAEASLSFLGLGVQPPDPSWGNIIADGKDVLFEAWWISFFPGLFLSLTIFSLYLIGESFIREQ